MATSKQRPAIIRAVKLKADLVRQVAKAQGVLYDETPEGDDIIVFSFKDIDDEASGKLALAMPREVFARRAVIGGDAPPGVLKKE
jgi:hypothetical protein